MLKCWSCAGALILITCGLARAHDPGLSTITLRRLPQSLEFSVVVNHADLSSRRRASSPACDAQGVLAAWLDGQSLPVQARCRLSDGQHTAFEGVLAAPHAGTLTVQLALLDELPRGHRCYARLLDASGSLESQRLLTRGGSPLRTQVALAPPRDFFTLGMKHMLTGSDHLVFLAVLLLGARGLRRMAALVSTFTLAHSLTLVLASIGWISVSSRWVEASIAVSIVWVAAHNLVLRVPEREHLAAAFGFGLIHGLGFASALRALNADSSALLLMQFTLGVELGQLAAGSLLVPCCLWLRRSLAGVRAVSAAAAALGCGWLLERVLMK